MPTEEWYRKADKKILDEVWRIAKRPPISATKDSKSDQELVGKIAVAVSELATNSLKKQTSSRDQRNHWVNALEAAQNLRSRHE